LPEIQFELTATARHPIGRNEENFFKNQHRFAPI